MVTERNKSGSPPKRRLWRWLLACTLILLIVAGIYAYLEITAMIKDLGRLWDDLVQMFWLIVPDGEK